VQVLVVGRYPCVADQHGQAPGSAGNPWCALDTRR
jgi:hypothetical protein